MSRDGGRTWADRQSFATGGGDDENLLRAVVYGKGQWLAMGWKLVSSSDGKTWTDHGRVTPALLPCNVVEGLAYANGYFYAACSFDPAKVYRSSDGLIWTEHGTIGSTGGHLFLIYRNDRFVAYGDNRTSFESTDAKTFTTMAGLSQATYCEDAWKSYEECHQASWFAGSYFHADWQGKISRSPDGTTWTTVYDDDQKNTLYQPRAIAAGYVAP